MAKKIGYSLTACVADIALNKVRIEDVAYVLTGQSYRNLAHMLETLAEWRVGRVDRHLEIARTLWESGRIFMPGVQLPARGHRSAWSTVGDGNADLLGEETGRGMKALREISFTADQRDAYKAMTSGRTVLIVGAAQSGRSSLAALAAAEWDSEWVKHRGKALVVCRTGRSAMQMKNRGVENVLTYEEIEEFSSAETLATLGKYRLFIFDDYDPAWGQVADQRVTSGLLLPSVTIPVVRIADMGTPMDRSADVVLSARLRAA